VSNPATDSFGSFGGQDPFAQQSQQPQQPVHAPQPAFGAFGGAGNNVNGVGDMFGSMSMGQQAPPMTNGGAVMGMQQSMQAPMPADDYDDDFGDFADAAPTKSQPVMSSDPLSKLISLDGLMKNEKKVNKMNEPVVVNEAAAQYAQNQQNGSFVAQDNKVSAQMSFNGIDGLNSMSASFAPQGMPMSNKQPGQPVMATMDSSGMSSAGNPADTISMLSPQMLGTPGQSSMMQQPGMMGNQPQMTQQQMQQPGMQQQMTQQQMMMMMQQQQMMAAMGQQQQQQQQPNMG
jgi:hypothetical protein